MFVREERSSPSTGILKPIDDANESNTRISRNKRCRCHDRCNYDNGSFHTAVSNLAHTSTIMYFLFDAEWNCLLTVFAGSIISSLLLIAPPPNASALPAMADAMIAASAAGCSSVVSTIILLSNILENDFRPLVGRVRFVLSEYHCTRYRVHVGLPATSVLLVHVPR